jgi:hypothetical protein
VSSVGPGEQIPQPRPGSTRNTGPMLSPGYRFATPRSPVVFADSRKFAEEWTLPLPSGCSIGYQERLFGCGVKVMVCFRSLHGVRNAFIKLRDLSAPGIDVMNANGFGPR